MAQTTTSLQHRTKAEVAAQWLREQIKTGELAHGERVRVDDLARDLGMSPTPIREALRLLQTDRLLDYRPHVGYLVASPAAFSEIMRLRLLLEPVATELAVVEFNRSPVLMRSLEDLHSRYRQTVESGRGSMIAAHNLRWHAALYEASGWTHLPRMIERLWEHFPWRTMWALPGHSERSLADHEVIMAAIRAGDATLASQGMSRHIECGDEILRPQVEANAPARTSEILDAVGLTGDQPVDEIAVRS